MFFGSEENKDPSSVFTDARDEEVLAASLDMPQVFEILVDRYQDAFTRKARSILGDREEVQDAVMETFTKIYLNASRFRPVPGASFSSWGYKILINTTLSYYKKLKRHREAVVELSPEHYEVLPDTADDFRDSELRDMAAVLLSMLPKPFERVLRLHILEDRSQEEVARIEGVSIAAVKTRVHRAKQHIKKLGELGIF
ncbi:MAG: hypothetical protein COW88_02985 [Candidatus Lloydbacteria bacterium CG22_combo_CG10-13_8_21_14_all_47_15]|uniref:RNA polymerase subunit sigma-24 n=1 Tax=Candidatus Lloydbacteria bacterium CG22_combo_CG10-13_8_21_14_all_47_15 TaxID=1974635 RepID=A0A2H0CT96_9BACT|nr:MAG: hypothetical protein COW88_02985 [Candidatus Lloydbacteria bacterium CG22_combo_CG10-13_8_21_14_all_47_15]